MWNDWNGWHSNCKMCGIEIKENYGFCIVCGEPYDVEKMLDHWKMAKDQRATNEAHEYWKDHTRSYFPNSKWSENYEYRGIIGGVRADFEKLHRWRSLISSSRPIAYEGFGWLQHEVHDHIDSAGKMHDEDLGRDDVSNQSGNRRTRYVYSKVKVHLHYDYKETPKKMAEACGVHESELLFFDDPPDNAKHYLTKENATPYLEGKRCWSRTHFFTKPP